MRTFEATEATLKDFISRAQFDEAIVLERDENWPRVTVVTPSFNQGRYLEQTILSVLNQNYPNLEFIIMDGGSTDNSLEIIRKYGNYLTHWESKHDDGQAAAIADGFRLASGDVLAYLNSDDMYLPGALRKVGEFFKEHELAQFMYGDCLIIDSQNKVIRRIYPIDFNRDIFLHDNAIIPQQAAFWRRDLYLRVGEIDRTLRFCMDYELWMRFMLAGTALVRVKDVLAAFRWHGDSKTSRLQHILYEEYRSIFQEVTGRPLGRRNSLKILYLRLIRYCLEPRGLLEAIRTRLLGPKAM